ncbi:MULTISPECIES: agmatine deiminase [unclassified Butyrivibrio]|uniref:agmatine deiminase n=1 Tax=unclassified Butyrivibrio TaxID=2639466 RepID=UPI0005D15FCC|nr:MULTISPECIES: agmatine deiminase [unclassified Butyrivibrio]SDB30886.1 agmatine deiminase [Butyrivibrio sp. INlla16]
MSTIIKSTPREDGFYMPAEYDIHDATVMIWPTRPGSWGKDSTEAKKAFCRIFSHILKSEKLYVLCDHRNYNEAHYFIKKNTTNIKRIFNITSDNMHPVSVGERDIGTIILIEMDSDDAWARDVGPTFVRNEEGEIRGIDWAFNAWGGNVDGLYAHWDKDDNVASEFCNYLGKDVYDAHPFVLEGGAIHSDGEGTVMVTSNCLLSKGRNPDMSQYEIEKMLRNYLGAEKVLWLPSGIYNDETNEHVDNVCAFTAPGEVVLAWTDDFLDPQYSNSLSDYEYLQTETDARGRKLKIHKLPIPDVPITLSRHDIYNYEFEEGEAEREVGERMAASYVNFYFTNTEVLIPSFGGENKQSDMRAVEIMRKICRNRNVVSIPARDILLGGGNIHCITQQIPASITNMKRKVINFE